MSRITDKSNYYKQRYRRYVFSIPRDDLPRLIEYLEGQKNWTEYFIMLVEQDMMHKGVDPDEFIFTISDRTSDE